MEMPDEQTQAHMVLKQTESGKTLSFEEREDVANAMLDGKLGKLKSPQMREALVEGLIALGVTSDYLAGKIREGIEAEETKYFQHEGIVTDSREVVKWDARHSYLKTALKLMGVEARGGIKINAKNFVYKPMLRGGGESVEIEAPKETVLKRRMAAAKHGARGIKNDD